MLKIEIQPKTKARLMDLVHAAGMDVSDWSNVRGGATRAATNPKYCYEWAFLDSKRGMVVLNLWYGGVAEKEHRLEYIANPQKMVRMHAKYEKPIWVKRIGNLKAAIEYAHFNQIEFRAIINDGDMIDRSESEKPASVKVRMLDPFNWHVESYDADTGDFILVRGNKPCVIDQYSGTAGSKKPERIERSSQGFFRDSKVRNQARLRSRGYCEYCGSPGFKMEGARIFIETHHIIPLSEEGFDALENVIALCPNHHREAHHGVNRDELQQRFLDLVLPKNIR